MNIPQHTHLPIEHLAGAFSHTASSYKFYWLLAILHQIAHKPHQTVFSIDELLLQMIAEVWYTVNDYRLSFGKQDKLSEVVLQLNQLLQLPANASKTDIVKQTAAFLQQNPNHAISKSIKERGLLVPFRFLTPWFNNELNGLPDKQKNQTIVDLANANSTCLYQFTNNNTCIVLQAQWLQYLHQHLAIVQGFCYWHLTKYLQKNNPNVPNIPDKLQAPQQRKLSKATNFWNLVLTQTNTLTCIYSGETMEASCFSIDHFLPWSFVAHDLLWNLLPVPKAVNSSKGNAIPSLPIYFDDFAALQYRAIGVVAQLKKDKLLEDYGTVFKHDLANIVQMPYEQFKTSLYETISPMAQIAANMGFAKNWRYGV